MISNEIQRTINGHLGAIPTDEDLSTIYQYMPVQSGWIYAQQRQGLGNPDVPPGTPAEISAQMLENQKTQLMLHKFTTVALLTLATISVWNILKGKI